jgi:hypothetical protein
VPLSPSTALTRLLRASARGRDRFSYVCKYNTAHAGHDEAVWSVIDRYRERHTEVELEVGAHGNNISSSERKRTRHKNKGRKEETESIYALR